MRPGITCLWQINGRNGVSFEKWMELDLDYIDKWSLWLDLKILLRTMIGGFERPRGDLSAVLYYIANNVRTNICIWLVNEPKHVTLLGFYF